MYLPQIFGLLASRCTCSGTELFNLPVSSADRTLPIVHSSILVLVFYLSAVSSARSPDISKNLPRPSMCPYGEASKYAD